MPELARNLVYQIPYRILRRKMQKPGLAASAHRKNDQTPREEPAMTLPALLAIGSYNEWDMPDLQAGFDLLHLASVAELGAVDAARRNQITALAYKGHAPFGAAEMDLLPRLEIIANYGVGYDAIDVVSATKRGVRVTNTPDVLNDDVADLAVGMLLAFTRNMMANANWQARGDWAEKGDPPLARKFSGDPLPDAVGSQRHKRFCLRHCFRQVLVEILIANRHIRQGIGDLACVLVLLSKTQANQGVKQAHRQGIFHGIQHLR